MNVITIERKVLEKNDAIAQANRSFLAQRGVFALNLVSSPGAGKTSLVESTLQHLAGRLKVAVVEGDVQTDLDAQRVARYDVPVVQIVTNGACHLEAQLVRDALASLPLDGVQCLIVENVGNLVCPAGFDLGEALKVVILSVTEGDDKPLKYPAMFRNAAVLVVNKIDLLPYVQCDLARLEENARRVNPGLRIFETSCTTGAGIPEWSSWLAAESARAPRGA
jgi:hydrogenase nickel incorporation protein HypB